VRNLLKTGHNPATESRVEQGSLSHHLRRITDINDTFCSNPHESRPESQLRITLPPGETEREWQGIPLQKALPHKECQNS